MYFIAVVGSSIAFVFYIALHVQVVILFRAALKCVDAAVAPCKGFFHHFPRY